MSTLVPPVPLVSTLVVCFGPYGAVTQLAQQRGVCRQHLYREAHAVLRALDPAPPQQPLTQLRQQLADAGARLELAHQQLAQAVVIDPDKQAAFAATAQALGVSLTAAHTLLAVLLGARTPAVPTLGRHAQQAGRRAGALLEVLDAHSRGRARQVAADELFAGRRPVLMTVEPDSLCWLGGRLAPDRDGPQWAQEFRQLPAAEQVTRDGGQGLRKGLELVNRERRRAGQRPVADQDDHFHLLQRARRAVREVRAQATRALRRAEQAQRAFDRVRRQGRHSGGLGRAAHARWQQAEQAFDRWAAQEDAFGRLRAALRLFTPEGELNTRARAEAEVRAVLTELTGPEWARAARRLVVPETFTFLDRVQEQLAALPLPAEVTQRLTRAEGLRRRPELGRGPGPAAAALRGDPGGGSPGSGPGGRGRAGAGAGARGAAGGPTGQ